MAYYEEEDEESQDPNNQSFQTSQQSGVVGASGAVGQGSAPNSPKPDSGSNFVGIQQYLNANKPQAEKLGTQVSGVIGQSADQARQGVSALNQEAQEKIKPVNSLSEDVVGKIQNSAEALTPEERELVKKTTSAQYKGPTAVTSLQNYQSAADATNKAKTNIEQSGTEQGRMGLISQVNSKPRTQGMNTFDNALLQAGSGREKLAQAASSNQDVLSGLTNAQSNIQNQIGRADDPNTPDVDESAGAIGQTNKAQSDSYKAVQDALNNWKSAFQPKVQQAQEGLTGLQQRVNSDIGDNPYGLDAETMELLGLAGGERLYGLDLNSYLNPASPADINAANVASSEDYARYGALADLAGDTSNLLNPADIAKAGTAPKLSANKDKLKSDYEAANQSYENAYNTQVGAAINTNYLPQQFAVNGMELSGYEGNAQDIRNATPQQLESYWLPLFQRYAHLAPNYQTSAQGLARSLQEWKANQGYNNVVSPNTVPYPGGQ
jgi:uncharacterized protein YoxC